MARTIQDPDRRADGSAVTLVPGNIADCVVDVVSTVSFCRAPTRKLAGKLDIKNADERRTIRTCEAVLHSKEFHANLV